MLRRNTRLFCARQQPRTFSFSSLLSSKRFPLLFGTSGFIGCAIVTTTAAAVAFCNSNNTDSALAAIEPDGTPDLHDARNSPRELDDDETEHHYDTSHLRWSILDALRFVTIVGAHLWWHIIKNLTLSFLRLLRIVGPESERIKEKRYKKIAVIGGGIGGCVAAWALRNTHDVTLYEQRPVLGGNAKVVTWPLQSSSSGDPAKSTTCQLGTGVLAWPAEYFRHYKALLQKIGHPTEKVAPRFMVSDDGRTATFRQGAHNERWDKDQDAWDRFIARVRNTNSFLSADKSSDSKSIYDMSLLNPFNVLSARTVARWHGVSDEFWDTVVVPLYSSSFLSTRLDSIPAVMMPIVDDIITVGKKGGVKELETWKWSSQHVFKELANQIGWDRIKLNSKIVSVVPRGAAGGGGVDIEFSGAVGEQVPPPEHYDAVIFACSAPSVDMLTCTNTAAQGRTRLFSELITNVAYCDHTDFNFSDAVAHTNEKLALPHALREEVLKDRYANYVRIDKDNRGKLEVENTFVLGSWIPDAIRAEQETGTRAKFYISYNMPKHRESLLDEKKDVKARITNRWAHPELCTLNQLIAAALRMIQGDNDIYYTGQFACLGTGHDISTTYSVVLARHLGAPYPFEKTPELERDFKLVNRYMGLSAEI